MNLRDTFARGRRLLALALPILVFVFLVLVGRHLPPPLPPEDALAATNSVDASPSPSVDAVPIDGEDSSRDAPRVALELLPDGGVIVDLNLADEDDLRRLPGIGPTRARAIVALRAKLGRFKSVDDLARIRGIGRGVLRKLRPFVRIG